MLKVGLTGNIASGKSTVADVWRSRGAFVIDADVLARRAVEPGTPALAEIARRWGPDVLHADGRLDRDALRDLVFRDPDQRRRLEEIVHPAVAALREDEYRSARRAGAPIVVADVPLLYEADLAGDFDLVVLVDAPEGVRRARIVETRGIQADEADRMIAAQMPAARKRQRADYLIDNDGSLADLTERAIRLWRRIERRAAGEADHAPA